jgi:hypothetical protein
MKRRIAAFLSTLLWALFTYIGYDLVSRVARRHVPGYPNAGQWRYYVYFPLAMLLANFVLFMLAKRMPISVFVALWIVQVVVFIPFLFAYGGGM